MAKVAIPEMAASESVMNCRIMEVRAGCKRKQIGVSLLSPSFLSSIQTIPNRSMTLAAVNPPSGCRFEEALKPNVEAEALRALNSEVEVAPSKWLLVFGVFFFFAWEEVTVECLAFSHGLFS